MMRLGLQIKAGDDTPRSPRNTESVAQKRKVDGYVGDVLPSLPQLGRPGHESIVAGLTAE